MASGQNLDLGKKGQVTSPVPGTREDNHLTYFTRGEVRKEDISSSLAIVACHYRPIEDSLPSFGNIVLVPYIGPSMKNNYI